MASSKSLELEVWTVDAFASKPFSGNPAAVCPVPFNVAADLDTDMMQNIAMEMNLSETCYIRPLSADQNFKTGSRFGLRWFTPKHEIKLCGHATLASAAVLLFKFDNQNEAVTFETLSGDLIVRRDGKDGVFMDFPVGVTEQKTEAEYDKVIKSLGPLPGVQDVRWNPSNRYLLIRLKDGLSRSEFEQLQPDISAMERSVSNVVVVIITSRGSPDQGYVDSRGAALDFVSRCFAPWSGVPEDPVTGSAQTVLVHYWCQELQKNDFNTRQCSKRGGEIELRVRGDRVHIVGRATFVMHGTLVI